MEHAVWVSLLLHISTKHNVIVWPCEIQYSTFHSVGQIVHCQGPALPCQRFLEEGVRNEKC